MLALVVAGALAYSNSLPSPFVLDDEDSIVRNPFITALWPLPQAMAAPPQSTFSGRPLASLSLALSYATGGLTPAVFRIWNLSILIASALVLFGIVRRSVLLWAGSEDPALPSTSLALATSLLRRLHP